MKGVAVKINRLNKKAYISRGKLLDCMGNMYHLIMPFIENDTDIQDRDIVIDYMAGDGFSFMIGENGVSVDDMVKRISDLKSGEKIKLSEIKTYL